MQGAQVPVGESNFHNHVMIVATGYPYGSRGNRGGDRLLYMGCKWLASLRLELLRVLGTMGCSFRGYWCSWSPAGGHKPTENRKNCRRCFYAFSPLFLGFHSETRAFL